MPRHVAIANRSVSRILWLAASSVLLILFAASHVVQTLPPVPTSLAPAPPTADWLAQIHTNIARQEYEFSPALGAACSAPNRAHDLRTTVEGAGVRVESRLDARWQLDLSLTAFGREGSLRAVQRNGTATSEGHRAQFHHADLGIDEWYRNDERGLEQGFDLERRPAGAAAQRLVFEFQVGNEWAVELDADRRGAELVHEASQTALRYAGLLAVDATQRSLDAEMAWDAGRLQILVDDTGAQYPLTVDPLLSSPSWSWEGSQANAYFGMSVATAGDVNGDGYSDMIVGASGYDNGANVQGRVFVYIGRSVGLNLLPSWSASLGALADLTPDGFGGNVATAGDVNGDGYDEILVSGSLDLPEGQGGVYLWQGGPAGIGNSSGLGLDGTAANADWSAHGSAGWQQFGISFGTAGDVNGDGFDDVVIGASLYSNGNATEGGVFLWHGAADGLGLVGVPGNADWSAQGEEDGALLGWSCAGAGDVNGDGYSDVIAGAQGRNHVYLWLGGAAGLGANGTPLNADWSASVALGVMRGFGRSVAGIGDVDGDGYSDILVGATEPTDPASTAGAAYAWFGGPDDLGANGTLANADWTVVGGVADAALGWFVAPAGDINGDGFADALVGAPGMSNDGVHDGRITAYAGYPGGLRSTPFWTYWPAEEKPVSLSYAQNAATLGDVNGDGFADIALGAPYFENGDYSEGKAFAFYGSADILENTSAWQLEGNQSFGDYGISAASAGDINGDGYSDVLVGADGFDGGSADEGRAFLYLGGPVALAVNPVWTAESNQASAHFAHSVAGAGDVNGDGYDDVLIGAPHYESASTQVDEGAAFLWFGGLAGPGVNGVPSNADWSDESDKKLSEFGTAVAGAGDIDGDGIADLVVGAPQMELGQAREGALFLYLGAEGGPSNVASSRREGNLLDAQMGCAVAGAGDVNGDGFSDLIVGADHFSGGNLEEGRVWVYHGSAAGLEAGADWFYQIDEDLAHLGASVAGAGDVNGDGYSDVIVGAPGADTAVVDGGWAFVFHGSATGLSLGQDWRASATTNAACNLGMSVAGAGDVNADGYSDVLIGAPGRSVAGAVRGTAALWLGSAAGLNLGADGTMSNVDWSVNGPIPPVGERMEFARCVASAGDVTGDGFSDVLIGCPGFGGAAIAEGKVFLHYGGGINGMDRAMRQRRPDDSAPLALLGSTEASLLLAVRARSVGGRDLVRLEWEMKPLGTPFDDTGHGFSPLWSMSSVPAASGSVVALEELVAGLAYDTVYKWRARVVVDDPFFPHGPWLSPAANGRTEWDFRSGSQVTPAPGLELGAADIKLAAAYPNPFSARTMLMLSLAKESELRLAVFDLRGRTVATLFDGRLPAGRHAMAWDGRDERGAAVASGTYYMRLEARDGRNGELVLEPMSRRVVLLR